MHLYYYNHKHSFYLYQRKLGLPSYMRITLYIVVLLLCALGKIHAQVESTTTLRIDNEEKDESLGKYSLSNKEVKSNSTLYSLPKNLEEYDKRRKTWSMSTDNGFLSPEIDGYTPKWFEKEKGSENASKGDVFLGRFKSKSKFAELMYRDHGFIDGDIIKILINGDVVVPRAYLLGSFKRILIDLTPGLNTIEIQALNEGKSMPNTAEFIVIDDMGEVITHNQWNLTTGDTANLVIEKN